MRWFRSGQPKSQHLQEQDEREVWRCERATMAHAPGHPARRERIKRGCQAPCHDRISRHIQGPRKRGNPCPFAVQKPIRAEDRQNSKKNRLTPHIYAFSTAKGNDHLRPGRKFLPPRTRGVSGPERPRSTAHPTRHGAAPARLRPPRVSSWTCRPAGPGRSRASCRAAFRPLPRWRGRPHAGAWP